MGTWIDRSRLVLATIGGALVLAGCTLSARDTPTDADPAAPTEATAETPATGGPVSAAEQKLIQLPEVDFYATQSLALRIAKQCEQLNFDLRRNGNLVALRGDEGGGLFGKRVQRRDVQIRTAQLAGDFAARHKVDLDESDLCAAGRAERAAGNALAASLRPAG